MKTSLMLCALLCVASICRAQATTHPPVGIEEHLGATLPLDVELYTEDGFRVPLSSILNRPTILMFVYFKCPGICTPLLTEVSHLVEKMSLVPGKEYQIITVSFDPDEKPDLAKDKKETYLEGMKKKIDPAGWRFMTGDSASIARLTDAAGFYYRRENGLWIHSGALIAVSPKGKITRYLTGIQHLPFDLTMAMYEAQEGRTGPTIAKVMAFCFPYDPVGKHYAFDIVRVSGVVIVLLAGGIALVLFRRPKSKTPKA